MNTEKFTIFDTPISIQCPMSDEHSDLCYTYILISQYIQNIQQLFLMFQVNLDQLEEYCTLFYNDKAQSRNLSGEVDLIKLNTLTVNIVSAGKTLIEQIEVVTKKYILDDKVDFKKQFISKKYDESFSYRFMYFIRNFTQHGHLPVSQDEEGKFYFDLYEILDTPDFKENTFTKELERYKQQMIDQFGTRPHLAYVYIMDEYVQTVYELYVAYYEYICRDVRKLDEAVCRVLQEHPEYIMKKPEFMAGMVPVYMDDSDSVHVFPAEDRLIFLFDKLMEEAKQALQHYIQANRKISLKLVYCLENRADLMLSLFQEDFEENLYEYCKHAAPDADFISFEKYYGKSDLMAMGNMYPYIYRDGHIIWNVPYEEVSIGDFVNTFPEVWQNGIEGYLNNVGSAGDLFDFLEQGWIWFINTANDIVSYMDDSPVISVIDWAGRIKFVYDVYQLFKKSFGKLRKEKPRVSEFKQFLEHKREWNIDDLCEILNIERELAVLFLINLGYVKEDESSYVLDISRRQTIEQYEAQQHEHFRDAHGTKVNCFSMNQAVENVNLNILYCAVMLMEQNKLEKLGEIVEPVKELVYEFQGILKWDMQLSEIKIVDILPDTFSEEMENEIWCRLENLIEILLSNLREI